MESNSNFQLLTKSIPANTLDKSSTRTPSKAPEETALEGAERKWAAELWKYAARDDRGRRAKQEPGFLCIRVCRSADHMTNLTAMI